ncbi:type IV pilus assembly protein PilM [Clostridium sp. HCP1S3_B4]|uniref:type IV pilus assembly protein PilM n=1 Tax=unclassified Clostridium TaxID=2614128 RepID=UPI0016949B5B|nr:type IV pilus assembly protein PilM [Clostridiales bacterium]MDY2729689.1 type IV pilus assembly protein PilM [Clostridium sp.]NLK23024.1 type IV pilus assembly protein PilM [Clostridiales bacterium]
MAKGNSVLSQDITMDSIKQLFSKTKNGAKKEKPYKPRDIVAFDIGTNTIKVVEGKYTKSRLQVYKMFEFATPEGTIDDGKIVNEKDLVNVIKAQLKKNQVKAKEATITTNSSTIISREVTIPVVADDEMETVIRYEVEQYLPIKLDDYIVQYVVLDRVTESDGPKFKVNVVAYPKITARSYYDLLVELDLTPFVLDVNYNALKKISDFTGLNSNAGTVAFVDMGATSFNVTIFKQGKFDFTRIIKYGGDSIDYALSNKLNMSVKSTESEKIQKANLLNVGEYDELNITIKESVDEILGELERILQFYNNQSVGNRIQKVMIYGGTSDIKGMQEYMEEKIGVKTEKVKRLNNVEFGQSASSIGKYINVLGSFIRV